MPKRYGRILSVPVVVITLASGCTSNARRRADQFQAQIRSQQHVIAGQSRKIDQLAKERNLLAGERDSIRKQLDEQQLLLRVFEDKASSSEQARDVAAEELQSIKKKLEELALREPEAFHWNAETGTLGVAAEVLFRPGKVELLKSGIEALRKVVPILNDGDEFVRVDGHTDSDPIKFSKWDDNWQLAGERARRVLKFLVKEGVAGNRLYFSGFGDTRPRSENSSRHGKRMNRRVELVPLPADTPILPKNKVSARN